MLKPGSCTHCLVMPVRAQSAPAGDRTTITSPRARPALSTNRDRSGLQRSRPIPAAVQDVDCTPRITSLLQIAPATDQNGNPALFCGQQVVGSPPPPIASG